ncbi:MAG: hypothetical protein O6943_05140 [Bacteroidetes bacterium]|nr:hypothetical protein [Bacteroidota bacterium]
MDFILSLLPSILFAVILGLFILYIYKKRKQSSTESVIRELDELKSSAKIKEIELSNKEHEIDLFKEKLSDFEEIKNKKIKIETQLENITDQRNKLNDENLDLKKDEKTRIAEYQKSIHASNTLQNSLEKEKERVNDERVAEKESELASQKETWSNHEKDVENHIRLICKNNVISYIEQNEFPYAGGKPDNTIEILEQLIIFDAKSPASEDLNNFPKYIKTQTENLKKYAKHENVKNDLFLVVPSNTLSVIKDFTYNIGDYNVFIISKDSLEPIILSLKKIEEYEFADKLSPEERDNVCRIIGKFAHTTKRKIQIEMFFMNEFLDILQKCGTQLPKEILKSVIEFENAEKLNPPMEKRNKQILTKDLIEKTKQIKKEIELREIPEIEAKITYKKENVKE